MIKKNSCRPVLGVLKVLTLGRAFLNEVAEILDIIELNLDNNNNSIYNKKAYVILNAPQPKNLATSFTMQK